VRNYPVNSRPGRVAVVYNEPVLPAEHPDAASERDVVAVAEAVSHALTASGYEPITLPVMPPLSGVLARLVELAPDLVFNLAEGFAGRSAGATHLTSLLELLGLAYTGSPVEALAACSSKARAKALLRGSVLPTAPWLIVDVGHPVPPLLWEGPAIVKPDGEDGSLGIDHESIIEEPASVVRRVEQIRDRYGGSVLLEAYLPGREFNVGVVALPVPRALPVAEVVYADVAEGWPILTYRAKWDETAPDYRASVIACPAPIDQGLASRLGELALAAYSVTGCRDYARVDLRLDGRGEPMILEVNPNPDIGPGAGLANAVRVAGMSYSEFVGAIAAQAMRRGSGHARHASRQS
jgi:D-alanine-D-alanine ligase